MHRAAPAQFRGPAPRSRLGTRVNAADADTGAVTFDEQDRPDLLRLWLEFDVTGHAPKVEPGDITLDGGDAVWRTFGQGVGVTGYHEADCLQLITDRCQLPLPPITVRIADVTWALLEQRSTIAASAVAQRSVMVWRGVWYPAPNLDRGPVLPGQ